MTTLTTMPTTMPDVIGLEHVEALGNVDESLASFYDSSVAMAATASVSEREIRDWIEYDLISEQGFRSQVLEGPGNSGAAVLLGLENAYLIRSDMRRGAQWFELSHDRLVGPVRTSNAAWRAANLSPLQVNSMAWDQQGRPDTLLATGPALAEAAAWAEQHPQALLPADTEFLAASEAQEHALLVAAKATRRNRILAGAAAMLAVLAIIGGFVLYRSNEANKDLEAARIEADQQREIAERSALEASEQREDAVDSEAQAIEQQRLAEQSADDAAFQRGLAEDSEAEAIRQQQLAEENAEKARESAAEAEEQRLLAVESATEAARLQELAEANEAEAARQRAIAENNAADARTQQQLAQNAAAEANKQRAAAEASAVALKASNDALALAQAELRDSSAEFVACSQRIARDFQADVASVIESSLAENDLEGLLGYADSLRNQLFVSNDTAFVC